MFSRYVCVAITPVTAVPVAMLSASIGKIRWHYRTVDSKAGYECITETARHVSNNGLIKVAGLSTYEGEFLHTMYSESNNRLDEQCLKFITLIWFLTMYFFCH